MSTPLERDAVLAEMRADAERLGRRVQDAAHQPGSPDTSIFGRTSYWEDQLSAAEARFDRWDATWRDLRRSAGQYPEPEDQAEVDRALARRDQLADECARLRSVRDACLAEFEQFRAEVQSRRPPVW